MGWQINFYKDQITGHNQLFGHLWVNLLFEMWLATVTNSTVLEKIWCNYAGTSNTKLDGNCNGLCVTRWHAINIPLVQLSRKSCVTNCVCCAWNMCFIFLHDPHLKLWIFFCFIKYLGSYVHCRTRRNKCWSSSKMCVIVPDSNPNWNVVTNFSSIVPTIKHKMVLHYSAL
jgi:hypothetical protein